MPNPEPEAAPRARRAPSIERRVLLALGVTLGVYTLSVATHLGEFWPFSIYPMFSRAGKPWTRATVIDVTDAAPDTGFGPWAFEQLPGPVRAANSVGISTNDMSKFVQLTHDWSAERQRALRALWQPALDQGRSLLLLRVNGRLEPGGDVRVEYTGLVRMDPEGTVLNPQLGPPVGAPASATAAASAP
jgi:hypothetical protein